MVLLCHFSKDCNAFKFHPNNNSCELAKLTYLEDTDGGILNNIHVDVNAAANGQKLYKVLCVVCHGAKGKGDGVAGAGCAIGVGGLAGAYPPPHSWVRYWFNRLSMCRHLNLCPH